MAAAGKWKVYDSAKAKILQGLIDFDGHSFKMALFLSTSNCDTLTHDELADLTNQVAGSFGYSTGGQAIGNVAVNQVSDVSYFDGDPVVWTASSGDIVARFAVIYDDTVAGDPLIAVCLLDTAPANVTATDTNTFTVTPHANGFFSLSGATTN